MKAENSILLVVNPIAGDRNKDSIIQSVSTACENRNLDLIIFETSGKKDEQTIENILNEKPISRVLVVGGDGTVSMVANCLIDKQVVMGIIPAGSANGLAMNFGIPDDLSERITIALSDYIMPIDVLFLNNKICLHIADIGLNAELVKNYETGSIRGKLGYLIQSIPTLMNSESPFTFSIQTNEETIEETGILLAIANANKFGTGANINPEGRINDGKFEILIFQNLDVIEILKTIKDNPDLSTDFVRVISTDEARITSNTSAPFQIDGEFIEEIKEVSITIKREKLWVAVPQLFFKANATKLQI